MIKQILSTHQRYLTSLLLIVLTCLVSFILSGCSFYLETGSRVIHSSSHIPAASLSGYYKIEIPKPKDEERYLSIASDGTDYFLELFFFKSKTKKTTLVKGHLLFNPIEEGWYAVSFDPIDTMHPPEQYHFVVKIGEELEKALNIHALSDEILLTLADRHGIKIKIRRQSGEFSAVGQVKPESLLGYLKDIRFQAKSDQIFPIHRINNIPAEIINKGFKEFSDPLIVNNESDLKKNSSSPMFEPYLKSVDLRGIPWGAYLLSRLYLNGWGVDNDLELAMQYANRSIQLGLEYGKATLADLALSGYGDFGGIQFALKMLHEAAENGHPVAAAFLGDIYRKGDGVEKNQVEALKWYLLAAEKEDAIAQYNLGVIYHFGKGVPQDDKQALNWYDKAAMQGVSAAQFNLGVMYEKGQGVSKNQQKAAEWYRKAAEQGNANAQNSLGIMYYNGEGVLKDHQEAVKWFQRAALHGNAMSQINMAIVYEEIDPVQSYAWRIIAAKNNQKGAQSSLQKYKSSLSLSQLEEAQHLADQIMRKIRTTQ